MRHKHTIEAPEGSYTGRGATAAEAVFNAEQSRAEFLEFDAKEFARLSWEDRAEEYSYLRALHNIPDGTPADGWGDEYF